MKLGFLVRLNSIFSPNSYGYGENFCFIAPSTQIFHNFYLSFGDAVGTLYLCTVIESQKWPSSSSPRFTTTNLNPLQMKELTYADIRKMALEHGIKDTRLHIGLLTNTSRNEKWFKARCTWFTCRITNRSRTSFQVPNLLPSYQKRTYPHSMKLPTRSFKKVVKVFWHLTKVQYLCNINMR